MRHGTGDTLIVHIDWGQIASYVLFAISCINTVSLIIWLIVMPIVLLLREKKAGAVDFMIQLQFRSLLNAGVAASISGTASLVKWAVVFILSFYLLLGRRGARDPQLGHFSRLVLIFSGAVLIFSWISSSYPVTASFKVLSYVIPFIAIMCGIADTPRVDWISKIVIPLGLLCFGSIVLISSSIGYMRNGHAFQGVFNHPNVYGVMLALFIAGYLSRKDKLNFWTVLIITGAIALAWQTESRTGMLSLVSCVLLWFFTIAQKRYARIGLMILLIFVVVTLALFDSPLLERVMSYAYKGRSDSILYSRQEQLDTNIQRFLSHPLTGTGFNVPYQSGIRAYTISFDLVTENGNLMLASLGDTGLLGTILFVIAYYRLYKMGRGASILLFFSPFLVSMGEMSFFSTNNFAIIMYLYFGIYASEGWKQRRRRITQARGGDVS